MQGAHLVGLGDRDLHWKISRTRRVPLDSWIQLIQQFDFVGRESNIKKSDRRCHRLHDLRDCSRYQPMIGVPVTAIWDKSHDCIWVQFCKEVFESVGHRLHVLSRRTGNRANFAIVQIEENWW